jgi:hypothetical protein
VLESRGHRAMVPNYFPEDLSPLLDIRRPPAGGRGGGGGGGGRGGGGVCVCVCVCVCVGVHCPLVATEGAALTRQTYMHEYTKINH